MTPDEKRTAVARYWMTRSREALESARDEAKAGRLSFAVNRGCSAAFYAASAVLLVRGHRFRKHSGVRAGSPPGRR